MKKIIHKEDYVAARRQAYPPLGDQLDALWKLVEKLLPAQTEADPTFRKVREVKSRFPKPPQE